MVEGCKGSKNVGRYIETRERKGDAPWLGLPSSTRKKPFMPSADD